MATTNTSRMKAIKPVAHLMVACFLFYTSILMTVPFQVDILLGAFCPGQTECSHVIFLVGAQQLVAGLGTVAMAPILGSLSDDYGRKPVFMVILFTAIAPAVVLASLRTQLLVYLWFLLSMVVQILRDAGLIPAALAYVADVVDERHRASAVGLTMAAISSSYLVGTVAALLVKVDYYDFWIAATLQISAAIYLQLFVIETNPRVLLLPAELSESEITTKLLPKPALRRQSSNLRETARSIWTSPRLRTIAAVDFMNSFALSGMQSFQLYYLKAAFNYGKDEYAMIVIIGAISTVLGQTLIYPALEYLFGERGVLWIGLVGTSGEYILMGLAWTWWVPYVSAAGNLFSSFIPPIIGTIVSRDLDPNVQGKIQGFMSALRSTAVIVAPLILTPLAAISLKEDPPFHSQGLTCIISGAAVGVAWLVSLRLPLLDAPSARSLKPTEYIQAPVLPEDFIHVRATPENLLQVPLHPETSCGHDQLQ